MKGGRNSCVNQAASLMKQVHKVEILPAHRQALPSLWGQLLTEGAKQIGLGNPADGLRRGPSVSLEVEEFAVVWG